MSAIAVPRIIRRVLPAHGPWPSHVPEALQRVYAGRGICSYEDAELKLSQLLPPIGLGDLDLALSLLIGAIADHKHIVIVGDFDCDGATGTAVAVRGLRLLGAEHVSYRVPHRMTHGYGLSPALVETLVALKPDVLVTVDNGIACHAGVAAAKAQGWRVLITDHHLPGPVLPMADAIVNPNLDNDLFPSKALAGVGVMFYLLIALRQRLREAGWFKNGEPDLSSLLDLVAVGTVADLVPLDRNNRLLVAAGLRRMRRGQCQPGLRALAEVSGRALDKLVASDIGFALGPRLNAAGRLEDMAIGIECLLSDDLDRARDLAMILDGINAERRDLQESMVDEAESLVQTVLSETIQGVTQDGAQNSVQNIMRLPAGLVLFDPNWHPGIIGLVASKIKDRSYRPVVAFAPADENSALLRGSARSILGFHIRDALAAIDVRHPGLIERFGGHAMAAGLSLRTENLSAFQTAFTDYAESMLSSELLRAELLSDGPLAPHELDRNTADVLKLAGPWGQGFAEPLFDNVFMVREWRILREKHLKLVLMHEDSEMLIPAIHFGGWSGAPPPERIHAAYQLEVDDFRGRNGVQLLIRHWQPFNN